jgi:hypothetical protein
MKVTVHTLKWTDNNPIILHNHKKVLDYFGISVNYTEENIHHGVWMGTRLLLQRQGCCLSKERYVQEVVQQLVACSTR